MGRHIHVAVVLLLHLGLGRREHVQLVTWLVLVHLKIRIWIRYGSVPIINKSLLLKLRYIGLVCNIRLKIIIIIVMI